MLDCERSPPALARRVRAVEVEVFWGTPRTPFTPPTTPPATPPTAPPTGPAALLPTAAPSCAPLTTPWAWAGVRDASAAKKARETAVLAVFMAQSFAVGLPTVQPAPGSLASFHSLSGNHPAADM